MPLYDTVPPVRILFFSEQSPIRFESSPSTRKNEPELFGGWLQNPNHQKVARCFIPISWVLSLKWSEMIPDDHEDWNQNNQISPPKLQNYHRITNENVSPVNLASTVSSPSNSAGPSLQCRFTSGEIWKKIHGDLALVLTSWSEKRSGFPSWDFFRNYFWWDF